MRKGALASLAAGIILLAPVASAAAQPPNQEPPRGPCNAGTMRAHETVPERNERAHEAIPHCPH